MQSVFTGAVQAGISTFLLPEEAAAHWAQLASVNILTYPRSSAAGAVEVCDGADKTVAYRWTVSDGQAFKQLERWCAR